MDLINDRKNDELPVFRAFVEQVLKRRSGEILAEQNKTFNGFSNPLWQKRTMQNSDVSLVFSHRIEERFLDMKVRKVEGRRKDKKHYDVHNRILMGNYAGIMKELTYGLTEQVKENIRNNFNNRQI